jgi:hypothetical protein
VVGTYRYTEQLLEMKDGTQPTKWSRHYKIAKGMDPNLFQNADRSYQGKTVHIALGDADLKATVDGKALQDFELQEVGESLRDMSHPAIIGSFLPTQPVAVGETWKIQPTTVLELMRVNPQTLDESKSKYTCKLVRVSTQDGRQRGVIEFDIRVEVKPTIVGAVKKDSGALMEQIGTVDLVIDGSIHDFKMKSTFKMKANTPSKELTGGERVLEKTVTPVK